MAKTQVPTSLRDAGNADEYPNSLAVGNEGSCGSESSDPQRPRRNSLPGVGIEVDSGHSDLKKIGFAYGLVGPSAGFAALLISKDVYVLKFGSDPSIVGVVFLVWGFSFPVLMAGVGCLMDQQLRIFSWKGWGRRAPWYLVHQLLFACCMAFAFLPPVADDSLVEEIWLCCVLLASSWCLAVNLNAIDCCLVEIYPFRQERVAVCGYQKILAGIAVGAGFLTGFLLIEKSSFIARVIASIFICLVVASSLEVVPILKQARQPVDALKKPSLRECIQVLKAPAFRHCIGIKFWHAAGDGIQITFFIYYLIFNCKLTGGDRNLWMMYCAMALVVMEAVVTSCCSMAWGKDGNSSKDDSFLQRMLQKIRSFLKGTFPPLRETCIQYHILGAIFPPLWLNVAPKALSALKDSDIFLIYFVVLRFFYSPIAFYRTNTFGWVVDEDCLMHKGVRREAVHAGLSKCIEEWGRGVGIVLFLGLGWAGLMMDNCELICQDNPDDNCVASCEQILIERQPQMVADYVSLMYSVALPICGFMCALHMWLFPIWGSRLDLLQEKQARAFKTLDEANQQAVNSGGKVAPYDPSQVDTCSALQLPNEPPPLMKAPPPTKPLP